MLEGTNISHQYTFNFYYDTFSVDSLIFTFTFICWICAVFTSFFTKTWKILPKFHLKTKPTYFIFWINWWKKLEHQGVTQLGFKLIKNCIKAIEPFFTFFKQILSEGSLQRNRPICKAQFRFQMNSVQLISVRLKWDDYAKDSVVICPLNFIAKPKLTFNTTFKKKFNNLVENRKISKFHLKQKKYGFVNLN